MNGLPSKWLTCKRCDLHKHRQKVVLGRGMIDCDVLLIGEAPGQAENALGVPFIGRCGQLLTTMLNSATRNGAERVFITNVCACRPCDGKQEPNRAPTPEEAWACRQRLEDETSSIKFKRVALLGKVAQKYAGAMFAGAACLMHPAYVLRQGGAGCTQYAQWIRQMEEIFDGIDAEEKNKIKRGRIIPRRRKVV